MLPRRLGRKASGSGWGGLAPWQDRHPGNTFCVYPKNYGGGALVVVVTCDTNIYLKYHSVKLAIVGDNEGYNEGMTTKLSFPEWFERQFLIWQLKQGKRKSLRAFAEHLGYDHAIVVHWMKGRRKPNPAHALELARHLGLDIYDTLGYERPDETYFLVLTQWNNLNAQDREKIQQIIEKARRRKP